MELFGGVEAGGTKFVCGVGTGPQDLQRVSFPTTSPAETIRRAVEFFQANADSTRRLRSIGVASFGPVDLHTSSPSYGFITSTPKLEWQNVDIVGEIRRALDVPVALDTDVNGAALAEFTWGAARGLSTIVYITVGTGIGGGAMVGGRLVHGLLHPEMGHILAPHDRSIDPFPGCCPFHGDCWEGLASGTAMERRWGVSARALPPDHPAWDLEAEYLSAGLVSIICTVSPQRLILGGGVMQNRQLLASVRLKVTRKLNHYIQSPSILNAIDSYIVGPQLGSDAGVLGAIALARELIRHPDSAPVRNSETR
jgi:fructokinase